jgi:hypothetical protein
VTDDELDALVLKKFMKSTLPMRYSDVAAEVQEDAVFSIIGDQHSIRQRIEMSVDRLDACGLIKDVTQSLAFHQHWVAANPLDALAEISSERRNKHRR